MEIFNLYAAWAGILLGFVAGAVIGLFFHDDAWAGGYASWKRRMLRLGHISFFGIALINLCFAVSVRTFQIPLNTPSPSYLLIIGAITMPAVCFLSAFRKGFRHLFPLPVISLLSGAVIFVVQGFTR